MYQDLIVNDMLIYVGTLLVGAAMFAFIGLCFIGLLLTGLAARALQLAALKLAQAVARQWAGLRGPAGPLQGSLDSTESTLRHGDLDEPSGVPVPGPTTEAVRLAEQ